VTPCLTLTCYGKQRRHFELVVIWRIRALCLNLTSCYFGLWHYRHFDFTVIWRIRAVFLNLTCCYLGLCATAFFIFFNMATYAVILNLNLTCYCNKVTILNFLLTW